MNLLVITCPTCQRTEEREGPVKKLYVCGVCGGVCAVTKQPSKAQVIAAVDALVERAKADGFTAWRGEPRIVWEGDSIGSWLDF